MIRSLAILLLVGAQDNRGPVPSAEAQRASEKLVREVFAADYAKKSPVDRAALAKKLLRQGVDTPDDAASRFVLLREAKDLALQAGDTATAIQALNETALHYDLDTFQLKLEALTASAPASSKAAAEALLKLADEALAGGDADKADQASQGALAAAKKAKDIPLLTKAEAKSREIADARRRQASLRKARETLAANPADPGAHLELGLHECLALGHWDAGLALLAKGSDDALKALAEKDLARPRAVADRTGLGDAWWARAEKESGPARLRLRERAAHWYREALPETAGLSKVRIEKRLKELGPAGAGGEGLVAWWALDEGAGTTAGDSSGRGNHGTFGEGVEWVEGRQGKALRFDGRQGLVTVPDAEALRITGDLTVALWFRKDSHAPDWMRIIGKGANTARNYGLWLEMGTGYRLLFQQYLPDGGKNVDLFSNGRIEVGQWIHVAAVVRGGGAVLYLNGREESRGAKLGQPATSPDPVTFGTLGFHHPFNGALDDVRVYSRALAEEEIRVLANVK